MFLKECKYMKKNVIRHIHNNLNEFSYSDEPDEEWIRMKKAIYHSSEGSITKKRWYTYMFTYIFYLQL